MAAKDYIIVTGWLNAYIAKEKKRQDGLMSQDRRIIKQGEIIGLIDWWLDSQCEDDESGVSFSFDSQQREGYELELTIKKKNRQ